ncbi:cytochrome c oxidase accessory protein CcoG [Elizabethkingia ursingii]|jgi:cytochrome c oxidase accessory protein FixG|uniref:Cytochrome c oxidase accessory protein CcoG n=1 Tax=Elizabethkingia ursingii TaxID=1756150 RepID=A0AAJ3NGE2_9FLAO|nr:cytochrome c oxidase accessory protein CcoG [Elizabethkingia ursingii]AQX10227.1 cytochrome c oxidase accessory protein CcoG [Elizabethkingia ursingii]KUY30616.1 cytochrome c oxidase accessory protein CcoG [Elizabethkingia ursingii]OPB81118.1 cytochrome c oxidase accessory protein CcoG [Elizabethkingia ursingii]
MNTQFQAPVDLQEESFRNEVGTMDKTGKRKWVFPRKPKGKFTNYRDYTSYALLGIFFILPFLKINNNPFFLFNILDRHFFIFGQPFYLQDFFILAIGAVTSVIFVMLFSIVFGRIFCGWLCPQTIFMEMVFRKIEYWIEGDRNKQMKLDKQEWNGEKIRKRLLKWSVFLLIAVIITHFMFMYIVGYEEVFKIMQEGPAANPVNFIVMIVFTGLFYFVFSWLREQVCTLICPYGRLQGVLIDKQTINVYYDYKRGENRSKWRNNEDRKALGKGDCIDCNQCVVVCPTGIDIRNGQQLECINCTACIDACDEIMEKVGLPKGLVRYATEQEIEAGTKFRFTPRMKATTVALSLLIGLVGYLMYDRGSMEAKFLKVPGTTFQINEGKINNLYTYTFLNKENSKKVITIKVLNPANATITYYGPVKIILKENEIIKGNISIAFPEKEMRLSKQNITIGIFDEKGKMITSYNTTFEGPFKFAL